MTLLRRRIDLLAQYRGCVIIPACDESESQWQIARKGNPEGVILGEIYVHPYAEVEEIEGINWFRLSNKVVAWIKRCLHRRVFVNMIFLTREKARAFTIKDIKYLDRIVYKGQYLIREKSVPILPFSQKFLRHHKKGKRR